MCVYIYIMLYYIVLYYTILYMFEPQHTTHRNCADVKVMLLALPGFVFRAAANICRLMLGIKRHFMFFPTNVC